MASVALAKEVGRVKLRHTELDSASHPDIKKTSQALKLVRFCLFKTSNFENLLLTEFRLKHLVMQMEVKSQLIIFASR